MYACDSGKSGSSLCYACYILGQGPGQVGSWSGQCGRKNFSYLDHVLNGRCRVCVSELSSPRPELGLAELGF